MSSPLLLAHSAHWLRRVVRLFYLRRASVRVLNPLAPASLVHQQRPATRVRYFRIARLLESLGILLRSASVASGTKLPVPEAVRLARHLSPVSLTLAQHRSVLAPHYKATARLLVRRRWGRAHLQVASAVLQLLLDQLLASHRKATLQLTVRRGHLPVRQPLRTSLPLAKGGSTVVRLTASHPLPSHHQKTPPSKVRRKHLSTNLALATRLHLVQDRLAHPVESLADPM